MSDFGSFEVMTSTSTQNIKMAAVDIAGKKQLGKVNNSWIKPSEKRLQV